MPRNNAGSYLEVPPGTFPDQAQLLINDRLRTIAAKLDQPGASAGVKNVSNTTIVNNGGGATQIILSVPGTIGIRSRLRLYLEDYRGRSVVLWFSKGLF